MSKTPPGVHIKGLRELDRALGRADKTLRTELRDRLKGVADIVATEARILAGARTSRGTGDLVRGIRSFALSGRAGVRSNAVHRGFEYPRRLEYEGRGGGVYGPRASLNPAFDSKADEVARAAEQLFDDMAEDFGRGL